jgi:hypothetical protein
MRPREHMLYLTDDSVRAVMRSVNPKTQTRRVVKLPHNNPLGIWEPTTIGGPNGGRTARGETIPEEGGIFHTRTGDCLACPYGGPGDRLWVREAWCHLSDVRTIDPGGDALQRRVFYRADYPGDTLMHDDDPIEKIKWRSSRFMPRWASRITLEIVSVRVERLLDITAEDAIAEGIVRWNSLGSRTPQWDCPPHLQQSGEGDNADVSLYEGWPVSDAREAYLGLWDSLNFKRGYGRHINPFVWRSEFRRVA